LTYAICRIARFFESWLLLPDFCTHHPTLVSCLRTRFGSRPVPDPDPTRTRPVTEPTLRTRTRLPHDSHTSRPRIATDPTCFASLTFLPQGCLRSSVASFSSAHPGRPGRPGPGQVAAHLGSLRHQAPHCAWPAQISIASRTLHSYWLGLTTTGSRRSWAGPELGLALSPPRWRPGPRTRPVASEPLRGSFPLICHES
jgi:hypothetical protein